MEGSFTKRELLKKIWFLCMALLGKALLDAAYYYYISPSFSYMKMEVSISMVKCLESYCLLCVLFLCTPISRCCVSYFFLNMQLVATILPMLTYYWLNDQSRAYLYAACACHLMEACLLRKKFLKYRYSISRMRLSDACVYGSILLFVGMVWLYCAFRYGMPQLSALNFNVVYEIRKNVNWEFPFNYFIPWCAKIWIPFGIALGLRKKKYGSVFLLQMSLLMLYLHFAHKAFLFTIVFVTAVYALCRKGWLYQALYGTVPGVAFLGICVFELLGSISLLSYLVRRVLILPAQLKFEYYGYFTLYPKNCFADGQIGRLFDIESKYGESIARTIGNYMGSGSSANTGYLGESFAQAGFFGMFLFSILIVMFLKALELLTDKKDSIFILAASSYWLYSLNDAAFLTSLLTGGGLVLLLVLAFEGNCKKEVLLG